MTQRITYTIAEMFAPYVANGDSETLSVKERQRFDELEQAAQGNAPEGHFFAHWSIETDNHDEFTRCEATGLMGSCYQLDAVYFEKKTP